MQICKKKLPTNWNPYSATENGHKASTHKKKNNTTISSIIYIFIFNKSGLTLFKIGIYKQSWTD